jgi:hypothetical protein
MHQNWTAKMRSRRRSSIKDFKRGSIKPDSATPYAGMSLLQAALAMSLLSHPIRPGGLQAWVIQGGPMRCTGEFPTRTCGSYGQTAGSILDWDKWWWLGLLCNMTVEGLSERNIRSGTDAGFLASCNGKDELWIRGCFIRFLVP